MTTLVDALIVTLGLDPKQFNKGQKDSEAALKKTKTQADKTNKAMQEGAKKAANALNKFRNEVLGLVAAFLGVRAVVSFGKSITDSDAALGYFAKNIGISSEDLSAWEGVAKRTGGTADDMANSLGAIANQMTELKLHGSPSQSFLKGFQDMNRLSGNHSDLNKFIAPTTTLTERMLMLADAFSKMKPNEALNAGANMGLGVGTIQSLMQGRSKIEQVIALSKSLNKITDRDTEQAQKRKIAWQNLADTFEHIGRIIIEQLSPVFLKLLGEFSQWLGKKENLDAIVKSIKEMAEYVKNIDFKPMLHDLKEIAGLAAKVAPIFGGGDAGEEERKKKWADSPPLFSAKNRKGFFGNLGTNLLFALNGSQPLKPGGLFSPGGSTSSTTSQVTIQNLNISTKGDPVSIAYGVQDSLKDIYSFSSHAQAGAQ
jgi:hypothetical protein